MSVTIMPAMRAPVKPVLLLIVAVGHGTALGFSAEGHRVVGAITETYLCPETRAQLTPLLDGNNLGNAGVWADAVRDDPAWRHTRAWHFIVAEDGAPISEKSGGRDGNVLAAIARAERDLANVRLPTEKRATALRFFVHFVADVHQPLHVGRAGDRGGNEVEVRWGNEPMSLHEFWDARELLYSTRLDRLERVRAIGALAMGQERRWAATAPLEWAEESRALRPVVYDLPPSQRGRVRLDAGYVAGARNVVNLRLAQAAVRLAGRLNRLGCPQAGLTRSLQAIEPAGPSH